jgi:hypothetical protein
MVGQAGGKKIAVTKRNKVKQLKWRGFLMGRFEFLKMADGFDRKC